MHQRGRAPVALSSWTNSTCSSIQFDPRPIGSCQTYRSTGFGAGFPAILPQHPLYQAELAPSGHAQPRLPGHSRWRLQRHANPPICLQAGTQDHAVFVPATGAATLTCWSKPGSMLAHDPPWRDVSQLTDCFGNTNARTRRARIDHLLLNLSIAAHLTDAQGGSSRAWLGKTSKHRRSVEFSLQPH